MSTALAITLRPTNDTFTALDALMPFIGELYSGMAIAVPEGTSAAHVEHLRRYPHTRVYQSAQSPDNRRYQTVKQALQFTGVDFIHYCDGDHAISRMAHHEADWRTSVAAIQQYDCTLIERTAEVFESYPPALRETERIINAVGSYLLGRPVDLGAGSRGFSRAAAEYLIQASSPSTHALATDSQWPILLHRAGFSVGSYQSSGATYAIATPDMYDRLHHVDQWAKRVEIAHLIVQAGLDAMQRTDLPPRANFR